MVYMQAPDNASCPLHLMQVRHPIQPKVNVSYIPPFNCKNLTIFIPMILACTEPSAYSSAEPRAAVLLMPTSVEQIAARESMRTMVKSCFYRQARTKTELRLVYIFTSAWPVHILIVNQVSDHVHEHLPFTARTGAVMLVLVFSRHTRRRWTWRNNSLVLMLR